eukprot:269906_1
MAHFSATNTLTNYIQESEISELSSSNTLDTMEQNSINKQLNDLTIQFKNSIKQFQSKDLSTPSLNPSFSMPQLPLFCDKSFHKKMNRKKPKLLSTNISNGFNPLSVRTTLQHIDAAHSCSLSSASDTSHSSISNDSEHQNATHNDRNSDCDNNQINQKLDLLIHIINSQQKLLQTLIKKTNKKRKVKVKCKSTQTDTNHTIPHIVPNDENTQSQQSPVTSYPPIPQSQTPAIANQNHNLSSNNIVSVPSDMLLKLLSAVTNNKMLQNAQQCQYEYEYPRPLHSINERNNKQLMSPKSTLYFSD